MAFEPEIVTLTLTNDRDSEFIVIQAQGDGRSIGSE